MLDLHLAQLDAATAESLKTDIARSEYLAARSGNLNAWLGLLQAYESPLPPPGMVDVVMDRVDRVPSLRLAAAVSSLPPVADGGLVRRPVFSLRELVALAACITFLVSVVIPGFSRVRSNGQRALCGGNLASIYQGLSQYAMSSNGSLPQTAGFVPGVNWLHPTAPGKPRMCNSRNLYLVVRFEFAKPETFVCPSAGTPARSAKHAFNQLEDFPSREHCGYDFQNMAGPTLPLGQGGRPIPLLADHNPLFDSRKCSKLLTAESNSLSHDEGAGQNVLYSDGRVEWMHTPLVPPVGDNIWRVEGIDEYTGTEFQKRPDDAFLVN